MSVRWASVIREQLAPERHLGSRDVSSLLAVLDEFVEELRAVQWLHVGLLAPPIAPGQWEIALIVGARWRPDVLVSTGTKLVGTSDGVTFMGAPVVRPETLAVHLGRKVDQFLSFRDDFVVEGTVGDAVALRGRRRGMPPPAGPTLLARAIDLLERAPTFALPGRPDDWPTNPPGPSGTS